MSRRKISEERILQIGNDVAEEMNFGNHTKAELRQVIAYWMDQHSKVVNEFEAHKTEELLKQVEVLRVQWGGSGTHPVGSFRKRTFEVQKGICHYCKRTISFYRWTIDHRTPVSRGGSNAMENKVGCCSTCNGAKANMTEAEFLAVEPRQRKDFIRKLNGHVKEIKNESV